MRLHRIKLRNYRGIGESEVSFADEGVTVIEGDNEVGKTSLAEGLSLLLEYHDSSGHRRVKAVQPVGRDEGPEVEVEISTGSYRFVYRKRWLRAKETVLDVVAPSRAQLTGREAHERVEAILQETLDPDLWKALRLEQGTELTQAGFAVRSLGRALDLAAGGDSLDDQDDALWKRIEAERERYFTSTGQPTKERSRLASDLDKARSHAEQAQSALRDLEEAADEMENLETAARVLDEQQAERERAVSELEAKVRQVESLGYQLQQKTTKQETATARHEQRSTESGRRQELIAGVAEAEESLGRQTRQLEEFAPALAEAERRVSDKNKGLSEARDALEAAESALNRATADRDHRDLEFNWVQMTERRDRVVEAQEQLGQAEAALEACLVDAELLQQINEAHLEVVTAGAAARSGAAVVEATALQPLALQVDGVALHIDPGATETIEVGDSIEIAVPDLVRLSIRAGAEASVLAENLRRARDELGRLCQRAGVSDLAGAQEAARLREHAERQREDAGKTIKRDLRDLTLDVLAGKVERAAGQIQKYLAERQADPPLPADLDVAKSIVADCERRLEDCRDEHGRRDAACREAVAELDKQRLAEVELATRREAAESGLTAARQALDEARAAQADEAVAAALATAEDELRRATEDVTAAANALAAIDPDTTRALHDNARETLRRCQDDLLANRDRRSALRMKLDLEGEQGLAQRLDEATTRTQHLEREHSRIEARAAAALLLHDTVARHRAAARQRYMAPFRERIEQFGRIVFGPTLEIDLAEDLSIARRTLDGVTLDFDQLSTGAKEQLAIISRLACASIVAADGGAPVMLDDALGWTDPRRLERMGAVISVAGRDCQVIILTCNPGRYANVGSARVVRLPA